MIKYIPIQIILDGKKKNIEIPSGDESLTVVVGNDNRFLKNSLTKADDTNVTLTLGGSPSTALLSATSLTLGWTGTLADSRITSASNWNTAYDNRITSLTTTGTSGASTLISNVLNIPNYSIAGLSPLTTKGDIFTFSTINTRLAVGANGKVLQGDSTASTGLSWSTPTYPSASGVAGKILRSDGTNNLYSTLTIPDTITSTQILYATASNTIGSSSSLVFDGTSLGIGITPLALVHIAAGTTSLAPFRLTTQASPLTTIQQGAMELIGNSLQFCQKAKRRGVMMSEAILISDTTITNTVSESSAIITASHGANYLEVGKCEEITLRGVIKKNNNDNLTIRIKYAGTTVSTILTVNGVIATGTPIEIYSVMTCRSTGVTGTMQFNNVIWIDGVSNIPDSAYLITIDTTTAQDTTVTAQWSVASANNILTINQGRIICIEPNR